MWDLLYLFIAIAFFALMIAYVRGCEKLGGRNEEGTSQ